MAVDETIFVPDIGFRPADVAVARVPVTREYVGRTVVVERAVSSPNGTELVLSITGEHDEDRQRMPPWAEDRVTLHEPGGRVLEQKPWPRSAGRIGAPRSNTETVRRTLTLEPLSAGTRAAELRVSGVAVPLEFEPGTLGGARSYPLDAVDERHGILVAARRIAFAADSTAIQLEVSLPKDERRVIRSIGTSLGPGACDVTLRDDAGRVHSGQRALRDGLCRRDLREVAVFPALSVGVRTMSLEIGDVTVSEQTEDLTLPVDFEGDITLGGHAGHAKVQRETDESRAERLARHAARAQLLCDGRDQPPAESVIEMECDAGAWLGDRRLLRPDSLWLTDRRQGCSFSFSSRGWVLSVPDHSGDAAEVTISSALVQYRGPWKLEIPLETS